MAAPSRNSIVVGIDGSQCSEQALQWAITEAKMSGRELNLVHTWDWTSDVQMLPIGPAATDDARRIGRAALDRGVAEAKEQDVPVTTHLLQGSPADELVKLASAAAMLVVGNHGRRTLSTAILGSVSKGCVKNATCPVVVVPFAHGKPGQDTPGRLLASRR